MNTFQQHALFNAIDAAWGGIEKGQWHNAEGYANQAIGTINALWWDGAIEQDAWSELRAIFNGWALHCYFERLGMSRRTYDGA